VAAGGVGGTVPYKLYRGHELQLAGAVIHAPVVEISDTGSGAFASRSIAGNIGAEILDRFRLVFDYRARTITFTPNARLNEPLQSDRTGLSLTQNSQDAFTVLATVPGSPADEAGLKAGDAIIAIDGRSVEGARLGFGDIASYRDSKAPEIELTVRRGTTTMRTELHPRTLLP
jgi:predicted metalloprotease with PDZ domain